MKRKTIVMCLAILIIGLVSYGFIPLVAEKLTVQRRYATAVQYYESGHYEQAAQYFYLCPDYKDSSEYIRKMENAQYQKMIDEYHSLEKGGKSIDLIELLKGIETSMNGIQLTEYLKSYGFHNFGTNLGFSWQDQESPNVYLFGLRINKINSQSSESWDMKRIDFSGIDFLLSEEQWVFIRDKMMETYGEPLQHYHTSSVRAKTPADLVMDDIEILKWKNMALFFQCPERKYAYQKAGLLNRLRMSSVYFFSPSIRVVVGTEESISELWAQTEE